MEMLREWLLRIVNCALLVSVLEQLVPDGAVREIARFCGGLVLILCMLCPPSAAERLMQGVDASAFSTQYAALEEDCRAQRDEALAAVIAEKVGAYIEDKARALGVSVTAEVMLRQEEGVFLPDRVLLCGTENDALAQLISRELGIAREKQEWREAE